MTSTTDSVSECLDNAAHVDDSQLNSNDHSNEHRPYPFNPHTAFQNLKPIEEPVNEGIVSENGNIESRLIKP